MIKRVMVDGAEAMKLMVDGKVAWERDGLPTGYTSVKYLESSGHQYIDTGIYPTINNLLWQLRVQYLDVSLTNVNGVYYFEEEGFDIGINKGNWFIRNGNTDNTILADTGIHTFNISRETKKWSIDGIEYSTAYRSTVPNHPIYLFARNEVVDTKYHCKERVFYSHFYEENNKLLRTFIPCLDTNNTPCMYDTISKQAFYNNGAGTFGYELMDGTYVAAV